MFEIIGLFLFLVIIVWLSVGDDIKPQRPTKGFPEMWLKEQTPEFRAAFDREFPYWRETLQKSWEERH